VSIPPYYPSYNYYSSYSYFFPTPSVLTIITTVFLLLKGKDSSFNKVIIVGFIISLSNYSFDSNIAIILHIIVTLVGVLSVRILNYEDKLENRVLFR
jgi:hypothetical protein